MIAGTLEVQMLANLAQIKSDMSEAKNIVTSTVDGMIDSLKKLAAGYLSFKTVNAFAESIMGAIEAGAELHKMAIQTGVSGEALSAFKSVARLSGTSIEEVAKGLGQLSKNMLTAETGTGKAAMVFKSLGLNVHDSQGQLKNVADFSVELAKRFDRMGDGTQKTGDAMLLLGRQGRTLLPFYADLAEAENLEARVSKEQQESYFQYEKAVRAVAGAKAALYNTIAGQVVPVMTALERVLLDVISGADGLGAKAKELAKEQAIRNWAINTAMALMELLDVIINIKNGFVFAFETMGKALGVAGVFWVEVFSSIGAIVSNTASGIGSFAQILNGLSLMMAGQWAVGWEEVKRGWDGMGDAAVHMKLQVGESLTNISNAYETFFQDIKQDALKVPQSGLAEAFQDQMAKIAGAVMKIRPPAQDAAAALKEIKEDGLDKLIDGLTKTGAKLQTEIDFMQKWGFATHETSAAVTAAALSTDNMRPLLEKHAAAVGMTVAQYKLYVIGLAEANDARTHTLALETEYANMIKSENEAIGTLIHTIEEQTATFGMTTAQITKYRIGLLETRLEALPLDAALGKVGDDLRYQIEQLKKLSGMQDSFDFLKAAGEMWTKVSDVAGKFFSDLVLDGKNAFSNLKQSVKSFAAEMLALFAKRYFLQMVAGVTGSSTAGALASSAGVGSGADGMMSLVGQGISSYLGSSGFAAGMTSVFGEVGSSLAVGMGASLSANLATLGIAAEAGTAAVGGMAATIGAAIPVIGWIVAIAAVLYAIFGAKGGAPKGGGSFMGAFNSAGEALTGGAQAQWPGFDNGRFYTPNQADSQMATLGQGIATSFFAALHSLGGTTGGMSFGIGFDTDPGGTAPNRISSQVRNAQGQNVFTTSNRDIGRDQDQIQPEMQLEASRMILAALQASTLPSYLAHVFDGITASTATQQQIQDLIATAQALRDIFEVVSHNAMEDIAQALADSMDQFNTSLRHNETAIQSVMDAWDGSLATTQNLRTATISYYQAQLQLLAGITQVSAAIDDMFGGTIRNIQMAGMTDQQKYDFYQQEAEALRAQAAASSDPATIQRLATQMNADITAAFGLLTPEQQSAMSAEFIADARTAQTELDTHLQAIQRDAATATQTTLDRIRDLIGASDDKMGVAADKQLRAAELNQDQHLGVDISVRDDRVTATVVNSGG